MAARLEQTGQIWRYIGGAMVVTCAAEEMGGSRGGSQMTETQDLGVVMPLVK